MLLTARSLGSHASFVALLSPFVIFPHVDIIIIFTLFFFNYFFGTKTFLLLETTSSDVSIYYIYIFMFCIITRE